MGLIINASIKKEDFEKLPDDAFYQGKNAKYLNLSIYIDDKNDKFGNNVSLQLTQSKEDREAKSPKTYLGSGKVVYSRGEIKTAKELASEAASGDEPF